jgi:hypothetical protein
MATLSPADRRRHRRVPIDVPIRISTIDPEIDPWTGRPFFRAWEERCENLSRGGALVRTREPLAPGRRVLLELDLPDGPSFEAIARVAWTQTGGEVPQLEYEYGLGIEFLGGVPEHMARLEKFLGEAPPVAAWA